MMQGLTIGQFASQAGVNVQTVPYHERRGLLPAPARRASGYRAGDAALAPPPPPRR